MFRATFNHWVGVYALVAVFLVGAVGLEKAHQFSIGVLPTVMCVTFQTVSYVIFFADMIAAVTLTVFGMLCMITWGYTEFLHAKSKARQALNEQGPQAPSLPETTP